jgi:hypothetical protein
VIGGVMKLQQHFFIIGLQNIMYVLIIISSKCPFYRRFLGMVNFYGDMWRQRSHILALLTKLTSNKAVFEWTDERKKHLKISKESCVMCQKTMLSFPEASDYQLGGVIMQDDKALAFYSLKLLWAQRNIQQAKKNY